MSVLPCSCDRRIVAIKVYAWPSETIEQPSRIYYKIRSIMGKHLKLRRDRATLVCVHILR